MKPAFLYAIAITVFSSNNLVADDRPSDLAAERLRDKQERQQRLEAERNEMREHARQLRESRRAQAEKVTGQQPGIAVAEKNEAVKTAADKPADAKSAEPPRKGDAQPQPGSSGYAIAESASSFPGPVFPPVPVQSLFNTPLWYGMTSRFGPYPNAGFAGQVSQPGTMPPPAPPFFGYLVMPPGSPVTVPYLAPATPADAGAESQPAPAATP